MGTSSNALILILLPSNALNACLVSQVAYSDKIGDYPILRKPAWSPTMPKYSDVALFCDGACLGNPGPGGWAYLLRATTAKGIQEKEGSGAEALATNNRMELKGAIEGLKALKKPCCVYLCCDSQYVVKGINEWLPAWKNRGWRRADKGPVLNLELWQELDGLLSVHSVQAQWVKGHAGHPENERVDAKARACAEIEAERELIAGSNPLRPTIN